jgi:pimeloyl-ACP methyl ester carboxylesterase
MRQSYREVMLGFLACFMLMVGVRVSAANLGAPPPGFTSASARVNGSSLHYLRGGSGPSLILLHGFPEDWVEYRAIMPRLAKHFTVVAVDLPGIGKSEPPSGRYEIPGIAGDVHALAKTLKLERPYVVGHDVGGHVAYAFVRQFPDDLRGAMILDVPMAGLLGAQEAGVGFWHVGFILEPGLAEKLVPGRQATFLGYFFDMGKFTPAERAYFASAYQTPQLHAAFQIYRAMPKEAEWSAAQTEPNNVPLAVAVGDMSPFAKFLPAFIEGYRAKGMSLVEGATITGAGHYVVADNPSGVAELIERFAGASQ